MVILEKEDADGSGGEEAEWGGGEEQSQLGHSRRGEAGTQNSPRWVSSLTHLVPKCGIRQGY
jgi:hypothetical protein